MLAVVFPGQGSQSVGMATDFVRESADARRVFEEAEEAFGGGLRDRIECGPEVELQRTEITQPAILTASIAIWRAIEARLARRPEFFAGHSLGEYSALVAAGGLPLADAVRLVRKRGAYMQATVPEGRGEMAAIIGLGGADVARICSEIEGTVAPANFNSPVQTVIAGEREAVREAGSRLQAAGASRVVTLPVSAPFHCALMVPAMEKLGPDLVKADFRDWVVPVVSNVTAEPYSSADEARLRLREQVCAPVRWVDCVERLIGAGVRLQLEVGPGKVLSGLAAKIDRTLGRANIECVGDVDVALERVRGLRA